MNNNDEKPKKLGIKNPTSFTFLIRVHIERGGKSFEPSQIDRKSRVLILACRDQ